MKSTRVIVHCYQGDGHQVVEALEFYLHHNCPVTVMSPADSPVEVRYPGVDNFFGGKRAYIGQDSLDRQAIHLKAMLAYPEEWFLCHDADSFLLDAQIPEYLYEDPTIFWSNQVVDSIPEHQNSFEKGWPHVAFQPPYFFHRSVLERLVSVVDDPRCLASPVMPFIDFYMVQLVMVAGIPWKRLNNAISCPIAVDLRKTNVSQTDRDTYTMGFKIAMNAVENEGSMVMHSVKNHRALRDLAAARQRYLARHPNEGPKFMPPPVIAKG